MNGWHGGMGAGGWILMVVLWVVLIAVIVWVIARLLPTPRGSSATSVEPSDAEAPLAILDRRLARGEIDPETYESLRKTLGAGAPSGGG